MNKGKTMQNQGFTLVELSIVIVLIGLIVAGIAGASIILERAKLRALVTEINDYKSAVELFRSKYNAIPGDMRNANSYFSGVENGNGDKKIAGLHGESAGAWKHLHEGGFIDTDYYGHTFGPAETHFPGPGNVTPTTPFGGISAFTLFTPDWYNGDSGITNGLTYPATNGAGKLYIRVSKYSPGDPLQYGDPLFTSEQANELDITYDDGIANTGKIITYRQWGEPDCTSPSAPSRYALSENENVKCQMVFHF